jgi:hypothetical protein
MASSLPLLTPEIQLNIADCLRSDKGALRNWSYVSNHFLTLLTAHLAESVTLRNTETSGDSVKQMVRRYGQYAKELHFKGVAPGDGEGDSFHDTVGVFPKAVQSILSDLGQCPNLKAVHIEFPIHFDEFSDDFYMFQYEETQEEVVEEEANEEWRALMAKTFQTLAQNTSPGLKSLVTSNLVPKEVSTFSTAAFHKSLGQMEHFELSVYGADNGAGWKITTLEGFTAFVAKVDRWFFNNLVSVTDLTIDVHEEGHLESLYANLPLNGTHMPLIKTLHLRNIFLCPELKSFLVGHANT